MNEPLNACEDLVALLHTVCDVYPDKPAVTVRDRGDASVTHTYYELASDSFALAAALCEQGLTGKHVAVACDNRYEGVVAFFGIVCSGGIAVLTDAQRSRDDIYDMLLRADASACFLSPQIAEMAGFTGQVSLFRLDAEQAPVTFQDMLKRGHELLAEGKQHIAQVQPDDVAVMTFHRDEEEESPVVQLTHRNLLVDAKAAAAVFPPASKVFSPLSLIHAYGLTCSCLVTFLRGAELGLARGPESLPYGMHTFGATTLVCTCKIATEVARRLREAARRADIPADPTGNGWLARRRKAFIASRYLGVKRVLFDDLNTIICGCYHLDEGDVRMLKERFDIDVLQCFAMPECSPLISVSDPKDNAPGTMGRILPCCEVKFDDKNNILVRGECLTPGYYGNPGQIPPLLDDEGWFNTGNEGHLDDKGRLVVTDPDFRP
ncbi:MAG: acyl--CoA ligase [Firmicutes bacterium]|nr:acyl--CoA ligase [Bacillota bacterium]